MKSYGVFSLTVTSPQQTFAEPLTLGEVKAFLNVPERSPVDLAEDEMLEGMITAAREQAEIAQGRDLIPKQWDLTLDSFTGICVPTYYGYTATYGEIQLRQPLVSVDLIQYRDSDGVVTPLVEDTDYIVDLARGLVLPPYTKYWPYSILWPSSAVLVRHTAGLQPDDMFWSDSGQRVRVGMKLLISEYWNNRLPVSYDIASGAAAGSPALDRIQMLLSAGAITRCH